MLKKVNVYGRNTPRIAIRRSTALTRTMSNVEIDTDKILELLKVGTVIAEVLPDGTEEFLNQNNYDRPDVYESVLKRREAIKKVKEEKEKEFVSTNRIITETKRINRENYEIEEKKFNDNKITIVNPDIGEVVTVKDDPVEEKKLDEVIEYEKEDISKEEVVEKEEDINVVEDVVEETTTMIDNVEEDLIEDVEDLR